jgi:hypothetical protein
MSPRAGTHMLDVLLRRGLRAVVPAMLAAAAILPSAAFADDVRAQRLGAWPEDLDTGKALHVVDETLTVRCIAAGQVLECSSESRVAVANTRSEAVNATFEADPLARSLEVNGVSVPLKPRENRQFQTGEATLPAMPGRTMMSLSIPVAFHIDASAARSDLFHPVLVTMHPLLSQYPGKPSGAEIALQSVGKFWKTVEQTRVVLQYPASWKWMPTATHPAEPPDCPADAGVPTAANEPQECRRHLASGVQEVVWSWSRSAGGGAPFVRSVALSPRAGPVFNGGFLVGAGWGGGAGCLGCAESIRLRAGYEIGIESAALLAVAGEFSPSDRFTIIPSFDVPVIPQMRAIPAVTFGFGVPVRATPDVQVGGRLQATLAWPAVSFASAGLVLAIDFFPAEASPVQFGGALQFGL